jgi:hypothetical protein
MHKTTEYCAGGHKNGEFCAWLAYVEDWRIVAHVMGDSTMVRNHKELLRRRKIRKFWADPKNRDAQSERLAQIMGTPERRESQRQNMKRQMADPKRREALSKGMKQIMRDPKRREAQSETMKRLKAGPEFEAHRIAAFQKSMADPENKARRAATLRKTLAIPAVCRRRIQNTKKATSTPAYRAAMSAGKKRWWDDLRVRLAGPSGTAKTPNRRGRPRMDERYNSGAVLRERGETWREITKKLDPDFAKDPAAAMHRMRIGVERLRRSPSPR